MATLKHFDQPIPKSSRRSRVRRVLLVQQTAEQLVKVLTIVSVSSSHVLVEQNVDIPVLHGRGGRFSRGGLQSCVHSFILIVWCRG